MVVVAAGAGSSRLLPSPPPPPPPPPPPLPCPPLLPLPLPCLTLAPILIWFPSRRLAQDIREGPWGGIIDVRRRLSCRCVAISLLCCSCSVALFIFATLATLAAFGVTIPDPNSADLTISATYGTPPSEGTPFARLSWVRTVRSELAAAEREMVHLEQALAFRVASV